MDEKIIKIDENNYLVVTGDVKQIKGNITKDEILRIYKLRDYIYMINKEIDIKKGELKQIQGNKKIQKDIPKLRIITIIASMICAIFIGVVSANMLVFILMMGVYTGLYFCIDKFIKTVFGTKEQNEIDEKKINTSIENKYQKLKEYERELTEIIERTNYQEKNIEKEKTWDDLFYTEEEIKLYTQESPAPFNLETIFTNVENAEEPIDDLQYELNGPRLARKLTQQKNNSNNNI